MTTFLMIAATSVPNPNTFTTCDVYIGQNNGIPIWRNTFYLQPGQPSQVIAPTFPGVTTGAVEVNCNGAVLVTQRAIYGSSFDEVVGAHNGIDTYNTLPTCGDEPVGSDRKYLCTSMRFTLETDGSYTLNRVGWQGGGGEVPGAPLPGNVEWRYNRGEIWHQNPVGTPVLHSTFGREAGDHTNKSIPAEGWTNGFENVDRTGLLAYAEVWSYSQHHQFGDNYFYCVRHKAKLWYAFVPTQDIDCFIEP
jgi:hypothetical protein